VSGGCRTTLPIFVIITAGDTSLETQEQQKNYKQLEKAPLEAAIMYHGIFFQVHQN
jgi:hypothetical protein